MSDKTFIPDPNQSPVSQIGDSLETLAKVIAGRKDADESSYTWRLLNGDPDYLLKKIVEEAAETALAAKDIVSDNASDQSIDHLRYEAGDVVYHLLVLLERAGITLDDFAAELNTRMADDVMALRPGAVQLKPESVNRGK